MNIGLADGSRASDDLYLITLGCLAGAQAFTVLWLFWLDQEVKALVSLRNPESSSYIAVPEDTAVTQRKNEHETTRRC
jgi:hypothetical protein